MDVKEAIKLLDELNIMTLYEGDSICRSEFAEALKMAISALEKQEGKKPTHEASLYRCLTCPNCKNVIDHFEEFVPGQKTRILYQHCHFCGQRIDWNGVR